ncbi:hypothetical protein HPG69_004840 [Diceros bicornis minor]|uniref:Uncharacterized protein n=1 Tax=Diceros bicornis minor TaxID=77932 RepID=A0A7J7E4Y2_DICBM|nr:hypothetical protein HPG69_004840 [Diceros bicornis minor]
MHPEHNGEAVEACFLQGPDLCCKADTANTSFTPQTLAGGLLMKQRESTGGVYFCMDMRLWITGELQKLLTFVVNLSVLYNHSVHPDTYLSMLHLFSVTVGPNRPASGFAEDSAARSEGVSDLQEVVSLKERMAMYQAAVSRGDCRSFSANMMEESEMCTVPGGLARVKKQFEKDKIASSCNTYSQYQYQHQNRSEQGRADGAPEILGVISATQRLGPGVVETVSPGPFRQIHKITAQSFMLSVLEQKIQLNRASTPSHDASYSLQHHSTAIFFIDVLITCNVFKRPLSEYTFIVYSLIHSFIHFQEVIRSSQVDISSSSQEMEKNEQEASKAHKIDALGTEMVSHLEKHTKEQNQASQFHQYVQETVIDTPEDEEIPKVSTKFLKEQFEKSAQEKVLYSDKEMTPAKQIKIESEYEETLKPSSVVGTSSTSCTSTSQRKETSTTRYSDHSATSSTLAQVNATLLRKREEFPPPPPGILQTPIDVTAFSQSPELPSPPRIPPVPKEVYSKQRNLYELNRLYKHIHPELRKNLEKDYIIK